MTPDTRTGSMALWTEIFVRIIGKPTSEISLIDLCCGRMGNTGQLKFKKSLHIDVTDYEERPKEFEFLKQDVLELPWWLNAKYDVALCSDGIEHLSRDDGNRLIRKMEDLSPVQVIFTPLGDYMVNPLTTDPEHHRSGWLAKDFPKWWETQEFPNWHPTLNIGALWAWHRND